MSGGGGGGGQTEEQHQANIERWKFDYEQMVNKHEFTKDQFEAQQWNQEQMRQHKNKMAQNEWADKEAMRIFDYKNQVKAYNASAVSYTHLTLPTKA